MNGREEEEKASEISSKNKPNEWILGKRLNLLKKKVKRAIVGNTG